MKLVGPEEHFVAPAGLDVHVLPLATPGLHNLRVADALRLQVEANNALADAVRADCADALRAR